MKEQHGASFGASVKTSFCEIEYNYVLNIVFGQITNPYYR